MLMGLVGYDWAHPPGDRKKIRKQTNKVGVAQLLRKNGRIE
jgi:hypothetical protein